MWEIGLQDIIDYGFTNSPLIPDSLHFFLQRSEFWLKCQNFWLTLDTFKRSRGSKFSRTFSQISGGNDEKELLEWPLLLVVADLSCILDTFYTPALWRLEPSFRSCLVNRWTCNEGPNKTFKKEKLEEGRVILKSDSSFDIDMCEWCRLPIVQCTLLLE